MRVKNIFSKKYLQKQEYIEFYASLIYCLVHRRFHLDKIKYWSGQNIAPLHSGFSYGYNTCVKWEDKNILISLTYPKTIMTLPDGGGTNMMLLPEETKVALLKDLQLALGRRIEVEFYTSGLTQEQYEKHSHD